MENTVCRPICRTSFTLSSRTTAFLFLLAIVCCCFSLPVSANSPPPPSFFYGEIVNAPAEAVYADILIPLDTSDSHYVAFNSENRTGNVGPDSPIVQYEEDGYHSFFCHYDGVRVQEQALPSCDFTLNPYSVSLDQVASSLKVALLDKDGNILQVSQSASLVPTQENTFARTLRYDAAADTLEIGFEEVYAGYRKGSSHRLPLTLPFLLAAAARMFLSIAVEALIGFPFRLRPLWKLAAVNLITQLMLLALFFFSPLSYLPTLILGEIAVYLLEFLAYGFLFREAGRPRIAAYTLLANTTTLLMGLMMNQFGILIG